MRLHAPYTSGFTLTTIEGHTIIFKSTGEGKMGGPHSGVLTIPGVLKIDGAVPSFVIDYENGIAAFLGQRGRDIYVHVLWFRCSNVVTEHRVPFVSVFDGIKVQSVSKDKILLEDIAMTYVVSVQEPNVV